jgi:gliding motility-associated-like protein
LKNKTHSNLQSLKAKSLAFGFWLLVCFTHAQVNYVPNPSFEETDTCGFIPYIGDNTSYWGNFITGQGWASMLTYCISSPTSLPTNQSPKTGKSMALLRYISPSTSSGWRSYTQAPLIKKLIKDKSYCITQNLLFLNGCQYATNQLGVYLDNGVITSSAVGTPAVAVPQLQSPIFIKDTVNWTKVQGTFTANGDEAYISLGNFSPEASLTYSLVYPFNKYTDGGYLVDDISVIEADLPAYAGRDTILCTGDSVFIGRPPEIGLECIWYNNSTQIGTGGGIWVKPATTQTYIVSQDVCGLIKTDTIQVQIKPKYTGTVSLVAQSTPSLVCHNTTVTLSVVEALPITNYTYNWQNTVTINGVEGSTITANVLNTTQFTITAYNTPTDAFCPYSFSTTVNVSVKPTLTLTPKITLTNTITCLNDTLKFTVINTPTVSNVSYNWQPFNLYTNTNTTTAKALIQNNSYYFVTLTSLTDDLLNCPFVKRDSIYISLQDTCNKQSDLELPQLISANGDGINDNIQIQLPNTTSATLRVFNWWGNFVAERNETNPNPSTPLRVTWDGTYKNQPLPSGTYFYLVESITTDGQQRNYKQFVVLVR